MKKIAITGSKGTIGTILKNNLKNNYIITELDLPEIDVTKYERLLEIFPYHDIIIHLAWDTITENFRSSKTNPDNNKMFINVYNAAIETKIPRVIMASSIHAENFYKWDSNILLSPNLNTLGPDSLYGVNKIFMETLGRYYAQDCEQVKLEVVCIRFGGVNLEDKIDKNENDFEKVWLSHKDLTSLVKVCIEAEKIPSNFLVIYGISNNSSRIHDYTNQLGWVPVDDSKNYL